MNLCGFHGEGVGGAGFYEPLAHQRLNYSIWRLLASLRRRLVVLRRLRYGALMAKQVRLTLAKAIAKANLRRAEAGERPITMNSLATQAGVAATTITRLARTDDKAASALSLDLASKIVTVLDCGIEDLLEVV